MRFVYRSLPLFGAAAAMLIAMHSPVAAQNPEGRSLTLRQALQRAFANNPRLTVADREIGIATGRRIQAGAIPNPELSFELDNAFGTNPVLWSAASPITQLDARIAPFMAVCTTQESASCPRAQQFVDKAASYGSQASVLPQNLNHGQINEKLGLVSAYTTQVSAFMSALFNGTVR